MDCLKNFIGTRQRCSGVDYIPPRSNLFIEDLEGLSMKSLSAIEPSKYISFQNMLNAKINFAGEKFVDIVRNVMFPQLVDGLIVEQGKGGIFETQADDMNNDYHAAENVEKGLRLKKQRTPLTSLRIVNVVLKAKAGAVISGEKFKIIDGINEYEYDIPDLNPEEEVSIYVDYLCKTEKVDIVWNTNNFEPSKGNTSFTQRYGNCSACSNSTYTFFSAQGLNNGVETTSLYGIRCDFIVECDMAKALCMVINQLKMPFLYAVGIELLKEWVASDSLSYYTNHGKDWAQNKIGEWAMQMDTGIELIKPSLSGYLKKLDNHCFTCKSFMYGHVHP